MDIKQEIKKSKNKIITFYCILIISCFYVVYEFKILFFDPFTNLNLLWFSIILLLILYPLVYFFIIFKAYFKSPYTLKNDNDIRSMQNDLNKAVQLTYNAYISSNYIFIKNILYFRVIPLNDINYIFPSFRKNEMGSIYIKVNDYKSFIVIKSTSYKSSNTILQIIEKKQTSLLVKKFNSFQEEKEFYKHF